MMSRKQKVRNISALEEEESVYWFIIFFLFFVKVHFTLCVAEATTDSAVPAGLDAGRGPVGRTDTMNRREGAKTSLSDTHPPNPSHNDTTYGVQVKKKIIKKKSLHSLTYRLLPWSYALRKVQEKNKTCTQRCYSEPTIWISILVTTAPTSLGILRRRSQLDLAEGPRVENIPAWTKTWIGETLLGDEVFSLKMAPPYTNRTFPPWTETDRERAREREREQRCRRIWKERERKRQILECCFLLVRSMLLMCRLSAAAVRPAPIEEANYCADHLPCRHWKERFGVWRPPFPSGGDNGGGSWPWASFPRPHFTSV